MSRIAEPYVCDGPACGKRRDSDANHWWLVQTSEPYPDAEEWIGVSPWEAERADKAHTLHACGIDCMLKLVGTAAARLVDGIRNSSTGKEVSDGKQQ